MAGCIQDIIGRGPSKANYGVLAMPPATSATILLARNGAYLSCQEVTVDAISMG